MSSAVRRVAAHEVVVGGETLRQCAVEIVGDRVVDYYVFTGELPMTEWLGGTIRIELAADGSLKAFRNGDALTSAPPR